MGVNIGPIQSWTQGGRRNMGSIEARYENVGRFTLDVPRFVLVYYRARAGQAWDPSTAPAVTPPTGTNDLEVRLDHAGRLSDITGDGVGADPSVMIQHSYLIHKSPGFGIGKADLNVRLTDEEMQAGALYRGDYCVFIWTNPENDRSLRWNLDVGLAELL